MINEIRLIGNVGQDPETREVPSGILTKISVATESNWKDKSGSWQSKTEWHRCVAFGFAADYIDRYIKKGMQVYIEGSMEYGSYEKDGITRYTAEVKVKRIKILGRKNEDRQAPPAPYSAPQSTGTDVPF